MVVASAEALDRGDFAVAESYWISAVADFIATEGTRTTSTTHPTEGNHTATQESEPPPFLSGDGA
jgi:hypothetical protein